MASAKTTYVLLVFVVMGLSYLSFFEHRFATTDDLRQTANRLFDVTADSIDRIKIYRDAWTSAIIERTGPTSFRSLTPAERPLPSSDMTRLLAAIEFLETVVPLRGDALHIDKLYQYGLSRPRLELDLSSQDGNKHRLQIGGDEPSGLGVYIRVDERPDVHVIDRALFEMLNRQLDTVVDLATTPTSNDSEE